MDPMKSAAGMTASPEDFEGYERPLDRPLGIPAGSRRRILMIAGLLVVAIFAAAVPGLPGTPVKPALLPLTGTWGCLLGGVPLGTLSIDGWNYTLASNEGSEPMVGTLQNVVFGKYREEFLKVQSGALRDKFGVNLGYHYHLASPETLVFSVGPESGIRCTRM